MMRCGGSLEPLNWVTTKLHMMRSEKPDSVAADKAYVKKIEQGKFISHK
jgi:hypothetical protein